MSLENIHERAWMKLSATPTGLIPEESLPFPGFGNPGLEYTIPLGLTSTSGRWKYTTQSRELNTAYRYARRYPHSAMDFCDSLSRSRLGDDLVQYSSADIGQPAKSSGM